MALILGSIGSDNLFGTSLRDILDGRLGFDTLRGGAGDDIYELYDRSLRSGFGFVYDQVIEGVGLGSDKVVVLAIDDPGTPSGTDGYTLPVNVERGIIAGRDDFNLTGNALDNFLDGNVGANRLSGGNGNDDLDGFVGFDTLIGGAGNDVYHLTDLVPAGPSASSRYDRVVEQAGGGTDTVRVSPFDIPGAPDVDGYALPDQVENGIILGALAFNLGGNALPNKLDGNSGKNRLTGEGGADMLNGGGGYDTLAGGPGNDVYRLDDFTDFGLFGSHYDIVAEAPNAGSDMVIVTAFDLPFIADDYSLTANVENASIDGARPFDLNGNGLANRLTGSGAANRLSGGGGDDRISGGGGSDQLNGQGGADTLNGDSGFDTLNGGPGNDVYHLTDLADLGIFFGSAYDIVTEGPNAGIDTIVVTARDDPYTSFANGYVLEANVENGRIVGSLPFELDGNALANNLAGNAAANRLTGFGGNDRIAGGSGNDLLFGGTGKDVLTGGRGADRFAFDTPLNPAANVDRLADFTAADDTILLDRAIFTRIGPNGTLAAAAFRVGTAAADASNRIIYDPSTGHIFYDGDGAGGAAQRLFAQVAPGTALGRTDFVVYSVFVTSGAAGAAGAEAGRAPDDALAMVGIAGQIADLGMIDLPVI